ncbi:hypothetical protein C9975_06080 [Thalassospira xiamenensis]|nr:hypothetical protein C9975_06080 [Thalassospira xiamenensis]
MSSQFRSRLALIAVVVAFLVPVIIAKLVLDNHWYQGGVTNEGAMLVPPIELSDQLNQSLPPKWRIGYVAGAQCDADCQQALYALNQTDIAIGRESDRVQPIVLTNGDLDFDLSQVPMVQELVNPDLESALQGVPTKRIFIIDPLGNVILHYEVFADEEKMRSEAKNMLADLRKLLKLSKIG